MRVILLVIEAIALWVGLIVAAFVGFTNPAVVVLLFLATLSLLITAISA
jgi:hypothetical protein